MSHAQTPGSSFTILKFLVIAMGVTMIVGFLFLLSVIYRTVEKEKNSNCASAALILPENSRIMTMIEGKKNQLNLLLEQESGTQTIAVFDSCNGQIIREFSTTPTPQK